MTICQQEEREAGRAYPRTCPTCRFGPCQKYGRTPLATLDALRAENDRLRSALSNIVHTFDERSDGSLVTFPGGYYQAMARAALVAKENEQCQVSIGPAIGATINGLHGSGAGAPDAVDNSYPDMVARLVEAARTEAEKAMRKFPQPNYVISKVAEEAGEVVKAAIHCAEGRETTENVRAEIVQTMAMLIRLYVEGDQVHGLPALAAMEAAQ